MWDRRRVWKNKESPAGAELVADSEAFLMGRLVEVFELRRVYVPTWFWMNMLAHGTDAELQAAQTADNGRQPVHDGIWRQARSYLAGEVLAVSASRGPLARVQQRVLVPLELELAAHREVERWSASEWVGAVEAALGAYRRIDRR